MGSITFRSDAAVDAALADLMREERDRSRAIREAILLAHEVATARRVRAEAEALANDVEDRDEARSILADMESLRAW